MGKEGGTEPLQHPQDTEITEFGKFSVYTVFTEPSEITQTLQCHHKLVMSAQILGPGTNPQCVHKPSVLTQTLSAGTSPGHWQEPTAAVQPPRPRTGVQCPLAGSCPHLPSAGPTAPLCHHSDSAQRRRG